MVGAGERREKILWFGGAELLLEMGLPPPLPSFAKTPSEQTG